MSSLNYKDFKKIIESLENKDRDFFFIQVGSNDGKTNDPLYPFIKKYNWSGILVEPIKEIFEKLQENYINHKNLKFENIAISDKSEEKDFYRLKSDTSDPWWADQIGSFEKDLVLKHKNEIPNIESKIVTEKVVCLTFNDLLEKYNIEKVDLLHIDAEGSDADIIKDIDFKKIQPQIIRYEYIHMDNNDRRICSTILQNEGYELSVDTFDIIGIKRSA